MSQSRRNVIIGFTVIGALIAIGWMLLRFGSEPVKLLGEHQVLTIHFRISRADGLNEGSPVMYRGVGVGDVSRLSRDPNGRDVLVDASIDNIPPLPNNVTGIVRTPSLISGQAVISLELTGGVDALPKGTLLDEQNVPAVYVGNDLIPAQFGELASELEAATHDFRQAGVITHLDAAVRQANDTLKSLQAYVNDPQLQDNVRSAVANFRQTAESARRTAANVEAFSGNLQKLGGQATDTIAKAQADLDRTSASVDNRLVQISKLLDSVQSITTKVDQGQGTAGQLLNDPKLYQSLVDSSRELNLTVSDLHRLIEQWEQEGVSLKLR